MTWGSNIVIGIESNSIEDTTRYFNRIYNCGGVPSCGELDIMLNERNKCFGRFQTDQDCFIKGLKTSYIVNFLRNFYLTSKEKIDRVLLEEKSKQYYKQSKEVFERIPFDKSLIYDKINFYHYKYETSSII